MLEILKTIFPPEIVPKSEFNIPVEKIAESIRVNRASLALVDNWIDEAAFSNSFFRYGIPDFIKTEINKPIDNSTTYTDLMVFLSKKHFSSLNYLEIGVSVGKNFFQLINAHDKGSFIGFDIEDINPVLEKRLTLKNSQEWKTPAGSIKKNMSSLKTYTFKDVQVNYLSADVWDENSWAKLEGNKFNIVFSDALHTPKAILFEFEMLVKYDLLDKNFIIVWDDLVGKMKNSFYRIIRKYDKVYKIKDIFLLKINGWVGQHEEPHSVGIISNFDL